MCLPFLPLRTDGFRWDSGGRDAQVVQSEAREGDDECRLVSSIRAVEAWTEARRRLPLRLISDRVRRR